MPTSDLGIGSQPRRRVALRTESARKLSDGGGVVAGRIDHHAPAGFLRGDGTVEAVIFVGLQGSGKSTFYRERFFDTHVRLSLDMLKTRHRERSPAPGVRRGAPAVRRGQHQPHQIRAAGLHPGRTASRIPGRRLLLPIPSRGLSASERAASGRSAGAPEGHPGDGGPDGTPFDRRGVRRTVLRRDRRGGRFRGRGVAR